MTDWNDHAQDLPHIDDDTVEKLLKGRLRPVPGELGDLVDFLEEMRQCIDSRPPSPSPALRYMLHHGVPAPSQAAAALPLRGAGLPTRPRRRALLAARVALGITIAAATITTAAATGVLPGDAERAVAGVVERFTPFQLRGPHEKAVRGGGNSSGAPGSAPRSTEDTPRLPVEPTERATVGVDDEVEVAVSEQLDRQSAGRPNGRSSSKPPLMPGPLTGNAEEPVFPRPADRPNEPEPGAELPKVAGPTVDREGQVPPRPDDAPDDAPDRTPESSQVPAVVSVDAGAADTKPLMDLIRAVPIAEEPERSGLAVSVHAAPLHDHSLVVESAEVEDTAVLRPPNAAPGT